MTLNNLSLYIINY